MSGIELSWQPDWVRPMAAEVADLDWLAQRVRMLEGGPESERAEGVLLGISWIQGRLKIGPVTSRPEQPVTRALAIAELWIAAAVSDNGGTREYQLRAAADEVGVPYYPLDEIADIALEVGYGLYQVLGWLTGYQDGWQRGRTPPFPIAARTADGVVTNDPESQRLAALAVETRDQMTDAIIRSVRRMEGGGAEAQKDW